ncbi:hypothetical protein FRC18_009769 [Serendipita sp. 400]|nr:hypothetical protein FRC18_009769 [Serendipita sp. 400]
MISFALPPELWLHVADYLTRADFRSLIPVNRTFFDLFTPSLYSDIIIAGTGRGQILKPKASRLLEMLEKTSRLRGYVRRCMIMNLRQNRKLTSSEPTNPQVLVFAETVKEIFILVGKFPSLELVTLQRSDVPFEWIFYICSQPNISLGIVISLCSVYGPVELPSDRSFNLTSLSILTSAIRDCMPAMIHMIRLSSSLRELRLDTTWTLQDLFKKHVDNPGISLPKLEILKIYRINLDHLEFFRSTPNLVELRFKMGIKPELGSSPIPVNLLPKLRRFSGHTPSFKAFITGRPVTDIETADTTGPSSMSSLGTDDNIAFEDFSPNFGSSVDILSLKWRNCTRNQALLQYVSEQCPKIQHLDLTPTVPYTKEELEKRLQTVKGLKMLRSLRIMSLEHVPTVRNLEWERRQCEALTSEGSPQLLSVSFSSLIDWNRKIDSKTWTPSGDGLPVSEMFARSGTYGDHGYMTNLPNLAELISLQDL